MKRLFFRIQMVLPWLLGLALMHASDSSQVKKLFSRPPREFTSAPLWVWNDLLTEDQIRGTMRDLASQGIHQVFVHPRPGLMTPYLSADWFRLWKTALREAERLDMNVWIYDENSYPSGFAGGWVPELMPESRGRGLHLREAKTPPVWATNTLAVFQINGTAAANVSERARAGESLPEGRYVVAQVARAGDSPWHGGRSYVDLLYPGVTLKFLEITLEAYRREIGKEFGKRVPGSFTDEPEITPAGGLPWTDDLPAEFAKRWGTELVPLLPSLTQEVGDWRQARHHYFQTLLDLFIERWAMPYFTYCAQQGIEFTGHYWDHEWPRCLGVPDNMAMAAWQQRPGIDILMNQYAENTHAQFGNVRSCREISSLANQLGRPRTLVELYGAGGWDLRFEDMKRIGDWLEVLGVNTLDEHLSYITLRGARKRDHPQSFSYHEPWWDGYHTVANYFSRVTTVLTQGEQINRVLVFEPTTTAWMYQGQPHLEEIGNRFFRLLMALESAQVEYDLGCEEVVTRFGGSVRNLDNGRPVLQIGRRAYDVVVLPPLLENLNTLTASVLADYVRAGGRLLLVGGPPQRINGEIDSEIEPFVAQNSGDNGPILRLPANGPATETKVVETIQRLTADDPFRIEREVGDAGILFHHRRQLGDGQLLFLVNTSIQAPAAGTVEVAAGGAEDWDAHTGGTAPAAFDRAGAKLRLHFRLPPCGSRLLFFPVRLQDPAVPVPETVTVLSPTEPTIARRVSPNVLTIDYVDVAAGGENRARQYFYAAQQFVFQKNGMDRNPWDSAVQFRDELIRRKFPPNSGFEASYRFVIEGAVPRNLEIVIERPDLYRITCNGTPVKAAKDAWWLDRAFGRIALAVAARAGENAVTIQASPFTIFHELEPAYVLGDFTLRPADSGFVIVPDEGIHIEQPRGAVPGPSPDGDGPPSGRAGWNRQGHPFYAQGVAYRQAYHVPKPDGRFLVSLRRWHGSAARVQVNGKTAGYIGWAPAELDVTKSLRKGDNLIEVVVIGTLKNTLGPHHGNPQLGTAWPGMFHRGPQSGPPPGEQYSTVAYGLFEPFELRNVK